MTQITESSSYSWSLTSFESGVTLTTAPSICLVSREGHNSRTGSGTYIQITSQASLSQHQARPLFWIRPSSGLGVSRTRLLISRGFVEHASRLL